MLLRLIVKRPRRDVPPLRSLVSDPLTGCSHRQRDFGPDKYHTIPPHGRWQHFEVGNVPRVATLLKEWRDAGVDDTEVTRCLIDLFFVSVLLDAGAGDHWRYVEPGTETKYERSEGIAVASLYMFKALDFAADKAGKSPLVDGSSPNTAKL